MQYKNKYTNYLLSGLIILIFFIALFGYGIYHWHWQGNFVYNLSRVVPYPAVLVDWEAIRYSAYLENLKSLKQYWDAARANSNVFLGIPGEEEIRERLVETLIEQKIAQIWARKQGLTVSPEEIQQEWDRAQKKDGLTSEVTSFLRDTYGWSESMFKERVLAPFLLQQKVKAALPEAENIQPEEAAKRAEEIYNLTQASGAVFTEIAKQTSDDRESAKNGGDLGYFSRGTFEPQVEEAIFSMKIGEISQPVKSSFGYHIILLDDLLYNDQNTPTQAAIKHILIKFFDFDDWLARQKNTTKIYRLVL